MPALLSHGCHFKRNRVPRGTVSRHVAHQYASGITSFISKPRIESVRLSVIYNDDYPWSRFEFLEEVEAL